MRNTDVAKQVLVRIGTSPEALDMAMQVALRDSVTRGHLVQVAGAIVKASSGRH